MVYSVIGIIAVIVLFTENKNIILKRTAEYEHPALNPYRIFLLSVLVYYIADILWGVLYHFKSAKLLFIDTSVTFVVMAFGVMLWAECVVAFFGDHKRLKTIVVYSGRLYAAIVTLLVVINFFTPILFTSENDGINRSYSGRYAIIIFQEAALLTLSLVLLVYYVKSRRKGLGSLTFFTLCIVAFLIAKMFFPQYPIYSIGYMLGLCFIHASVIESEKEILGHKKEKGMITRASAYNRNLMVFYLVDPETGAYTQYSFSDDYTALGISEQGNSFFEETKKNTIDLVYREDIAVFNHLFTKENILDAVKHDGVFIMEYRLNIGGEPIYVRLKASEIEESEKTMLVIGVENIDAYIKREQSRADELFLAKEIARKDSLTGVSNKYAFTKAKEQLAEQIEKQEDVKFAVVIFDINSLKFVNDTKGHQAGDELIQSAGNRICDVFRHSPVYRIGGDEFAVICTGKDYKNIDMLLSRMDALNRSAGDVQIAFAVARYRKGQSVDSVVESADRRMYRYKAALKTRRRFLDEDGKYESQKRYRFPEELKEAYESSPLSFVYYQNINGHAVPVLISDGFCRNTGMPREIVADWLINGMFERMHPDDVGAVSQISDDFLHQRGAYDTIFRCRLERSHAGASADDQYEYIHGIGKWQTMPDGVQLAVITYSNLSITQEAVVKKLDMYMKLRRDSFYSDPLTGIQNINYLHEFGNEKLSSISAEGKTPIVVYFDIFSMQSYNNQYGFKEGDILLCLTASTLVEQFPTSLVVRDADDHFVMVTDIDSNEELETQLKYANKLIRKKAHGNTLGIRCGVFPVDEGTSITEAIDRARIALKRIESDINREVEFYSPVSNQLYFQNKYIIENLDRALKEEQIKVYYHSIHRVENQKIAAFECLARWHDPERGVIGPGEFIPVLLKHHQLYKLDLYVFEQICKDIKIRFENHLPLVPVSINFSRQDFDHIDVLAEINRLYEKHGMADYVDKSYFIVEITEQDLEKGEEFFKNQLKSIRENHYPIWLDDFGSGYSSISSFSQYRFDLIKFDMNLIKHLDDNHGVNRILLEEMVRMAKKLGIHTLIEGSETQEQFEFIKKIGCELVQGYYFRKPESLDEILEKVKRTGIIAPCETREERDSFDKKWLD